MSDPAREPFEHASLEGESPEAEPAVGGPTVAETTGAERAIAERAGSSRAAGERAVGEGSKVPVELLDELAGNLLWRIGRVSDDGPVTVRVGLASSADLFQTLPRLRSASDGEVEAAISEATLKVEWVGARPKVTDR